MNTQRKRSVLQFTVAAMVVLVMSGSDFGMTGALGLFAADDCGAPCPCDHARLVDDGEERAGEEFDQNRSSGPCDESPCEDGCPDCNCCAGPVVAVGSGSTPCVKRESSPIDLWTTEGVPASRQPRGVFRPPRRCA